MKTINFSEARKNLKAVFDRVIEDADVTIITRRDAEDVVVMSLAEWNSWKETDYLLASPANASRLMKAIADLDAGKGEYHELIDAEATPPRIHEPRATYGTKPKGKPLRSARAQRKRRG